MNVFWSRYFLVGLAFTAVLHAQQPWTAVATPATQTLWGVTAGGPRFVAVGEGGAIVHSPDGTSRWSTAVSNTSRWLLDVARSPVLNLYVAVGEAGTILTSTDGGFWTPQSSGTTQRLNSVLWGGDRFLVVGENGTALTSSDGVTWAPRVTGDTGWLRGIAYGDGRFVVTGHDGTVLVSNDGGATFHHGLIATQAHLDAAIFTGDRFYVTGANLVIGSSIDGIVWTLDPTLNPDGREDGIVYNGLVYFNQTLLAVGDRGRIRDQFGGAWNSSAITTDWRAVAATSYTVVAVGTGGQTAFTHIGGTGYHISPAGTAYVGRRVELRAELLGSPATPFNSQWSFNGQPITGATNDTLVLAAATLADVGLYRFTSSVANGIISGSYRLELLPLPVAEGLVDRTFSPPLTSMPEVIETLADGRLYVAGAGLSFTINGRVQSGLARLLADGSVDSSFNCGEGITFGFNTPVLYLQSDGRLVVWARTRRPDGVRATPLARYLPSGAIDSSFQPDAGLRDTQNLPILLADGRWLSVRALTGSSGQRELALARFNADGSADRAFGSVSLTPTVEAPVAKSDDFISSTLDRQGRVYVGTSFGYLPESPVTWSNGSSLLLRLNADGTPDRSFTPRVLADLYALQAAPDGIIVSEAEWVFSRPVYRRYRTSTRRLRFDGTDDPDFHPIVAGTEVPVPTYPKLGRPSVLTDGSLVMTSDAFRGRRGFVRFDAKGDFDPDFGVELGPESVALFGYPAVPQADGRLLLRGNFTQFQGAPAAYLVRVTPDTRAGATHLANLAVRAQVPTAADNNALILGFVSSGGTTTMLARAAGPALEPFGVSNWLDDPQLDLFAGSTLLAHNDDWSAGPVAALLETTARLRAFAFPGGSRDSALLATNPAGPLTLQVSGQNPNSGVALAELYFASEPPVRFRSPRIDNFSVRASAGTGASTLVVGFTVGGASARTFLIRAAGPALTAFGLSNTLRDPVLTLYHGERAIVGNDNWDSVSPGAIYPPSDSLLALEATRVTGAFPFNRGSRDAALAVSLSPGLYTAHVTSADGINGVALVEVYEIP
jgi:uncharacterized delta-60 repeat protein